MTDTGDPRGVLYPTRLPTFHREPVPEELSDRIRWFWIPRWSLAAGRTSRQEILPFPASNLVVQREEVSLAGPTTGASHRDLSGTGWAVGALLRPAGVARLHSSPGDLAGVESAYAAAELHASVVEAMSDRDEDAGRRRAVNAFVTWAKDRLDAPDDAGLMANAMEDLIAGDPSITRVDQVADRLSMSTRAVQRLSRRYVGLAPLAIIRRYRLQEAAMRLREDPATTIAQIAADLGYADHAHLTTDFTRVLGYTPTSYRREPG
ncbi:helix-turn-helix transcriptional regulator [Williamsia sterculiae]|uniref:Helix-turn-helix domain-containing protein n=1 Tax=Williamsia sterculiae TaxID=1344003 RepID=A0A1N7GXX4_9NOCA|nr:helix-turn-helix transcriptional regulator [Williamsia sterculiae]SIS17477.1 Helix-turn-helix domain-containing protein [Williamsia sterculiae]